MKTSTLHEYLFLPEENQVKLIFGYYLGNNTSLASLRHIVGEIKKAFPNLTEEQLDNLHFREILSSRRVKHYWECNFVYPNPPEEMDDHKVFYCSNFEWVYD